jgi:multidrug efflux pump subunit AcrA (membrane-fusion protein)
VRSVDVREGQTVTKGQLLATLDPPFAGSDAAQYQAQVQSYGAEAARLRAAEVTFRNDIISGPGGQQVLLHDPAGNLVELYEPADR